MDYTKDNQIPQTIEELKEWYDKSGLPAEKVTRFFIGKNIKQAKAFGIYKDSETGICVVYKNKANGERAVRYTGYDESFAVKELYNRLLMEIDNQINHGATINYHDDTTVYNNYKTSNIISKKFLLLIILAYGALLIGVGLRGAKPQRYTNSKLSYTNDGTYVYNDTYYELFRDNWYKYDKKAESWKREYFIPMGMWFDSSKYKSKEYNSAINFYSSEAFENEIRKYQIAIPSNSSSSSSGRYHYSSSYSDSSWDSSSTDWDSDW